MKTLPKGTRVRMTEALKRALIENGSGEHVNEFGECIGIVEGPVDWGGGFRGPELDVRWQPSNLRYMYHPDNLDRAER